MSETEAENYKTDILPYDFIKENEVIVSETEHGYLALSPYKLTITLYHEIRRFLKSDFKYCTISKMQNTSASSIL